jgi:CRISPR/Cas system-associated protein endoribonuclease Cas2
MPVTGPSVDTKEAPRETTSFREFLPNEGFEMNLFSIRTRFCKGKEHHGT